MQESSFEFIELVNNMRFNVQIFQFVEMIRGKHRNILINLDGFDQDMWSFIEYVF